MINYWLIWQITDSLDKYMTNFQIIDPLDIALLDKLQTCLTDFWLTDNWPEELFSRRREKFFSAEETCYSFQTKTFWKLQKKKQKNKYSDEQ